MTMDTINDSRMLGAIEKADVLIEALPYIQQFRGATVVVKLGGSAMESREHMESILTDVVFMECIGMNVAIVHGGGKAISRGMEQDGLPPRFLQGLRVTCERTIAVVSRVLTHEVNPAIVRTLRKRGADAVALHGDTLFTVRKKTGTDPDSGAALDWGFVGDPVDVSTRPVREIFAARAIPVITPLGGDAEGRLHNINADIAAAALARALPARKLAFVSDVPGLLRDPQNNDTLIHSVAIGDIPRLRDEGVVGGGMLPKLNSCADAIRAGVHKVHLVDGRMPHSLLLEIFTNQGVGTEIVADE